MDSFSCNFNILIAGMPRVMGVVEILNEWIAWRTESVRRRVYYMMKRKEERLHLLLGLKQILLDIDRAIRIIRETDEDGDVIPNLMAGFGIDQVQAEYVAEIKLRNINKGYILKRVEETAALETEIADLKETLEKPQKVKRLIISEMEQIKKNTARHGKRWLCMSPKQRKKRKRKKLPTIRYTYSFQKTDISKKSPHCLCG